MPTTDCSNKEDTDKIYVERLTEMLFFTLHASEEWEMAGQTTICLPMVPNKSTHNSEHYTLKKDSLIVALWTPIQVCSALKAPE